uniref:Lipoprotein n=1 Tax=Caulobacter sp. (strain K31) TaxID=366602 RepID=B0T655_CAUSK
MTVDRRRLLATGLLLALGGCMARGGVTLVAGSSGEMAELETLNAATAGPEGLTLRVASNGCTRKEDFVFYVDHAVKPPTVAFARKRLDACHAAAGEVALSFSYQELGVAGQGRLAVLNPVGAR